jgi:hypothetical protein
MYFGLPKVQFQEGLAVAGASRIGLQVGQGVVRVSEPVP